jgi:hypothetical protein
VLTASCGNCHSGTNPLPAFAQDDEEASYEVTQGSPNGELLYDRILARAVDERTMPPGCGGGALGTGVCLSQEEADLLEAWVEGGALP